MEGGGEEEKEQVIRVLCPVNLQASDRVLWLIGTAHHPLTILSAVRCLNYDEKSSDPDFEAEADALRVLVPKGLEVVGAILVCRSDAAQPFRSAGESALKMRSALMQQLSSGKIATVIAASAASESAAVQYGLYSGGNFGKLETLKLGQITDDFKINLWTDLCLLRCQMELTVSLYLPTPVSLSDFRSHLKDAVDHITADLKSSRVVLLAKGATDSSKAHGVVLVQPFNQLRANEAAQRVNVDLNKERVHHSSLCLDLSQPPAFFSTSTGMQLPQPVELTVMLQQSRTTDDKVAAPVVKYLPADKAVTVHILKLSMAVVCMGGSHEWLIDASTDLVLPALRDQLGAMHRAAARDATRSSKVCAYQFFPPGWLHPVTAVYDLSNGELELGLVEERKQLHERLGLRTDRPMLRAANAIAFQPFHLHVSHSGGKRLTDIHVGLPSSGVSGGQQSLVDGSYEYYHYLQDRVDDNGWGCAYRSLQTIVSWFKLQQYTTVPVPSHRDVQQTLVDIEDKSPSFAGSQEWIGAIELSFVLDKLLGVSCKILNVRTGADMPSYCRELALHFQSQGTPVMIGGGVLAYTLLGVDYNEFTGESAFLILDPHYTGGEDMKLVRSGGWCGWKRAETESGRPFFLHNKFYNLLLPQRPSTV